jgi:Na+-translocating ferredoxin:NAD+ oxidoreductase RnfC subunit
VGDTVQAGQAVAEPAPKALGAIIHSPFAATVSAVTSDRITLTKK